MGDVQLMATLRDHECDAKKRIGAFCMVCDAIDLIERLQSNERAQDDENTDAQVESHAENECLKTEVARLNKDLDTAAGFITKHFNEVERLREVLACIYRQVARPVGLMERIWFLFTGRFLAKDPTDG